MRSVFILVEGFGASERHALASMFSLSRGRGTVYWQWRVGSARGPSVLLVDGSSNLAVDAALIRLEDQPELVSIWVLDPGAPSSRLPSNATAVLRRPIDWPALLATLDAMFAPQTENNWAIDLEIAKEPDNTMPDVLESTERVLMVDANREHWLLVRAWLASRGFCDLDETGHLGEAKLMLEQQPYAAMLVSDNWPKAELWPLVAQAKNRMAAPFVLSAKPDWRLRLRARLAGVQAILTPPLDLRPLTAVLHSTRN